MGWCHEFGSHVREGCGHPMVAGQSSCSCAQCGVECRGKFTACATVWDRGPRQVTIVRAPATDAPRAAVPGALQPMAGEGGARREPADRVETNLAGVLAEVRLLHDAVSHQQRSLGQPGPEPAVATERLLQLTSELPNRIGSAVRKALETEREAARQAALEAARQAALEAPDVTAQLRELLPRYVGPIVSDAVRQALAPVARRAEEVSAEVHRLAAASGTTARASEQRPSPWTEEQRQRSEGSVSYGATKAAPTPAPPGPTTATQGRPSWQPQYGRPPAQADAQPSGPAPAGSAAQAGARSPGMVAPSPNPQPGASLGRPGERVEASPQAGSQGSEPAPVIPEPGEVQRPGRASSTPAQVPGPHAPPLSRSAEERIRSGSDPSSTTPPQTTTTQPASPAGEEREPPEPSADAQAQAPPLPAEATTESPGSEEEREARDRPDGQSAATATVAAPHNETAHPNGEQSSPDGERHEWWRRRPSFPGRPHAG